MRDRPVAIPPRALAVLQLLVEEEGRLVTKEALIEKVWAGAFIEESNITKSVAEVRRVLRPGFKQIDPIRTVWKQGYRFDVPVTFEAPEEKAAPAAPLGPPPLALALPPAEVPGPAARIEAPPRATPARLRLPLAAVAILAAMAILISLSFRNAPTSWGRNKVAVLGVRNLSADRSSDWMGTALTELLTSELQTASNVAALPAERISTMRADLRLPAATDYDASALLKVRSYLGCQLAVTGAYLVSGNSLRLDLQIRDTSAPETRGTLSETGSPDQLIELVARAGAGLRRALGGGAETQPPPAREAVSADALKLYAEGVERLRAWDTLGAQQFLSKALETNNRYAPIHASLSLDWSLMGYDARAREEARQAVENANSLPRKEELQIEARYAEVRADWSKAAETWRALWRFYPDQLEYVERLASALTTGGKAKETAALLRNLRSSDPRLLLAESSAALALSEYAGAVHIASDALGQARRRSARTLESRALTARGIGWRRLSEFEKARADFQEAGRISAEVGDKSGAAEALLSEADLVATAGKGNAEEILQRAMALAGETGNLGARMRSLTSLGGIRRRRADMEGARQALQEAIAIARETGNAEAEAVNLVDLGNIQLNTGHPAEARKSYSDGLQRGTEIGNRHVMTLGLTNLGILDYFSGDLVSAFSHFQDSLKLKREIGDKDSIAYTLTFLGRVSISAGRLEDARRYLQESDAMLRSVHEFSMQPVMGLARLAIAEGRPEEAETPLNELTAKVKRPAASEIWCILAESWLARGNLDKARAASVQASAWAAKSPNRVDFGIPADLMAARLDEAAGATVKARSQMEKLMAEARRLSHVPDELNVRLSLAELEKRSGNSLAASALIRDLQRDSARMGFGLITSAAGRIARTSLSASY